MESEPSKTLMSADGQKLIKIWLHITPDPTMYRNILY